MTTDDAVLIVGSGAAGAHAARQALDDGFRVILLDFGNDDPVAASQVPDAPFSAIRSGDHEQRAYLIDEGELHNVEDIKVGAHLTPPRQFITRCADRLLPYESQTLQTMRSLALGGLTAGWGAGAYTFEESELRQAGLPVSDIRRFYDVIAADIGVAGAQEDDNAPYTLDCGNVQPALEIDTNADAILQRYNAQRARVHDARFVLGRAPVAALSKASTDETRAPNPYFDMDFYGESRRSVYRAKYTIEQMMKHPRFTYVRGALVTHFNEDQEGVTVFYRHQGSSEVSQTRGAMLLLAANAVNTARIVLASFDLVDTKVPILSNPYHYIPCVNLPMLGRPSADRRHSLAQLFGIYMPEHRNGERVTAAFYSYRALLLYKLVKEMPLPVPLGLLAARALMTSFTIVGVHHPDRPSSTKWLQLGADGVLRGGYELDDREKRLIAADLYGIKRVLRMVGCIPLTTIDPGYGSSIHYAGTLPADRAAPVSTEPSGRISRTRAVYAVDSSGWTYLPAKGLTFTIMANARRVTSEAGKELRRRLNAS